MPEAPAIIAYIGACVGLVGGGIAIFNAHKAVQWKRAELANSYLKDLTSNQELVFACRAFDWNGGILVVPEALRPLLQPDAKTIEHDPVILQRAMSVELTLSEMNFDKRLQIYRTAVDGLLSWLSLVSSALDRNLFGPDDVREVGYWVLHIEKSKYLEKFILEYGYQDTIERLRFKFKSTANSFRHRLLLAQNVASQNMPDKAADVL